MNKILSTLLCCYSTYVVAQTIPANKYRGDREISYQTQYTKGFYAGYGYIQTNLLNPNYGINRKQGIIKPSWGSCFQLRYIFNPLIIDADWFSANYKVNEQTKNSLGFSDSTSFKQRGLDIFACFNFLPFPGRLSKVIIPYAGVGYQFAEVAITNSANKWYNKSISSKTVNNAMWKFGIAIMPVEYVSVVAEIKQSFSQSTQKGLNQYYVGFNYHLLKSKKR